MRSLREHLGHLSLLALAGTLLGVACSEDTRPPGNGNTGNPDATTTSTRADTGSAMDAGGATDAGVRDSGAMATDAGRADRGILDATSYPECEQLAACCAELPGPLQNRCMTTSTGGDPAACTQDLNLAMMGGYCTPDAGGPPRDAGPAGPVCQELLDCCPTLPLGQGLCMTRGMGGDENGCQTLLDTIRRLGQCAAMPDAGMTTDAGVIEDASSTGDVGSPPDATAPADAGPAPTDATEPQDASEPADAGPAPDATQGGMDAALSPPDATPTDAAAADAP